MIGLFRRKKGVPTREVPDHPGYVAVPVESIAEYEEMILRSIGMALAERPELEDDDKSVALALAYHFLNGEPMLDGEADHGPAFDAKISRSLAAVGYWARAIELQDDAKAREDFNEGLIGYMIGVSRSDPEADDFVIACRSAATCANLEPISPTLEDDAMLPSLVLQSGWSPDLRNRIRAKSMMNIVRPDGTGGWDCPEGRVALGTDDLHRAWKYGYFFAAFMETQMKMAGEWRSEAP